MKRKGSLTEITDNCLIGFDAEWTKNYKIKNGNVPFCFSIITVNASKLNWSKLEKGDIEFKYIQYYCENREDFKELITMADIWFAKVLNALDNSVLCGHQISSDFSVLYNSGVSNDIESLTNIKKIREEWGKRKETDPVHIIDTRYDIVQEFLGKSRRLVDMCNDFKLDVTQPELKKKSMTKLQNSFFETKDEEIFERISVMNLRHSLCAIVLYWLNGKVRNAEQRKPININKSVYNCLKGDFAWVASKEFSFLLGEKI